MTTYIEISIFYCIKIMDCKIEFSTKYRVSKKGNKIVCIVQHYCNKDYNNQEFAPIKADIPFSDIVKIKTQYDAILLKPYINMTVEEVFEIAVKTQNWEILPYSPMKTIILPPVFAMDWFKGNEKDIEDFFNKNPNGKICERNSITEYTLQEWNKRNMQRNSN